MRDRFRQHRAFSLVELLIVIAVIAIISALAIPNILGTQEAAGEARRIHDEALLDRLERNARTAGATEDQIQALRDGESIIVDFQGHDITFTPGKSSN